jgi:hypothetical protein
VHASCVKSGCVYTRANLIQAACTSETLKNKRTSKQSQEEIIGTKNQYPLKTQILTLTEKRKQLKENFIEQNQSEVKPKLQNCKNRD